MKTNEKDPKILEQALHDAELDMSDLEQVAGGLKGCDTCSPGCVSSCQPGNVNPQSQK